MNIFLTTVKMTVKGRNPIALDQMTIRGSNIRYIVLADTLQLDSLLKDDEPKVKKIRPQIKRVKKIKKDK